jgi:hypothetical protein
LYKVYSKGTIVVKRHKRGTLGYNVVLNSAQWPK